MIRNGATHLHRLTACLLIVVMLMTTCLTTAFAADVQAELSLQLLFDDGSGTVRMIPATPVSDAAGPAYWANADAAALNQTLTVEAVHPDPAYSFYLLDEWGNPTSAFVWHEEMDARSLDGVSAYSLYYDVDGRQADQPILLYVSSLAMPEEAPFQPFPVSVPVYYVAEDGTVLDTQYVECWAGETTPVWANSANVADYALTGADRAEVYVDEAGAASPAEVTFTYVQLVTPTPVPTEVPTPTPVAQASVPVVYFHQNGSQLDFQELLLAPGTHTVYPESSKAAAYELVSDAAVTVTVYPDGVCEPSSAVFYYDDPAPAEAVIPVYYYHEDGTLLDMKEVTLTEGVHTITADSANVAGLELIGSASAEVTVYADGSASAAYVQFTYKTPYVAPAEAVIPVYYYHEDGTLLDMKEVTLTEGVHTITADSANVAGLELVGSAGAEVTVYQDGSASAAYVQFIYRTVEVPPVEASVTVNYYHADGTLLDSQSIVLPEGTHIVTANSDKVGGYLPVGLTSVEVAVYQDGSTHPGTVEFYYENAYVPPVTADLTILYQLSDCTLIARDSMTLTPATHTIVPDMSRIGGYLLTGEQSALVYVDEQGHISPESVVFTVHQAAAEVTVRYQDDRGRDVAPAQVYTFTDGLYHIPAAPENLPENYELAPGQQSEIVVTVSGGAASQSEVYFYYQQVHQETVRAQVIVGYFDTYGNEIAGAQTVTLEPGVHQLTADASKVPQGYELVSDAAISVEVYENGTYSPQEVAFYYRKAQTQDKTVAVTVRYSDDRGNDVASPVTLELGSGTHIIHAAPADLPAGYELFAGMKDQVEITVRDGVATQTQVVFYYQKTQAEAVLYNIPVYYYDTLGNQLAAPQYVEVAPGSYTIKANPVGLPAGCELMMEEKLTVVVHQDGSTDPEEIAFYYRVPEKKATIIVVYQDQDGRNIIEPFTMELGAGYHTIEADASLVPSGYQLDSAKPAQVYVSREGEAQPSQVTLTFAKLVRETPIPVGETVYRYATVKSNSVALRSEPTTAGGNATVKKRIGKNKKVFVLQESYNSQNEIWAMVNADGEIGYMMSMYLDIMTQAKSDAYAAGSTAVPTFTPVPTATPAPTATPTAEPTQELVEQITPPPTPTPTLEPLPVGTATPTEAPTATPTASPTATAAPYSGYALTTRATALRTGISSSDMSVLQALEANELVSVINQVADPVTGEIWSIVSTLGKQPGFVQDASLRYISDKEAEPYLLLWEEQNKTPEPTQYVSPTPEPMQVQGYGVVLGDEVPFRQMASEFSRIIDNLAAGTVVYITGQTPADGQYWHSVNHENRWGYIRADLVRMMTIAEEEAYIEAQKATPTPATTNLPFDTNGLSSYGYVDGSSVNWREGPSTGSKKVGELKRYAFCLVLDSEYVDGVTWYRVSYGEKTGYLHGDFFKQMTISELEDFLGSDAYLQGIASNSPSSDTAMDDVGFTGPGGIVSAEDQWINKNPDVYASFEPFSPIATVAPIQTTPTLEPLPGMLATPTASPSPTPTFNPLPDVTYPTTDDGKGGSAVIWVVVVSLLLLAVGGVLVLVRYQQNRRRIAMRAAQRRAQAARVQQQRPYARNAAQGQPRTGTYPNPQQATVRRPSAQEAGQQTGSQYAPYGTDAGYGAGSYYRPAENAPARTEQSASNTEAPTQPVPRVGRRTAYRQSQESNAGEGNSLDV